MTHDKGFPHDARRRKELERLTLSSAIVLHQVHIYILTARADLIRQWKQRGLLPESRGRFMGHDYWLVKDIVEWAREHRPETIRDQWKDLSPGELPEIEPNDIDSWDG